MSTAEERLITQGDLVRFGLPIYAEMHETDDESVAEALNSGTLSQIALDDANANLLANPSGTTTATQALADARIAAKRLVTLAGVDSDGDVVRTDGKKVKRTAQNLGTVIASDAEWGGGMKPWDGVSTPTSCHVAFQAAQLAARIAGTEMTIAPGVYFTDRTLTMMSTTGATTSTHKVAGVGASGSLIDPTKYASVEFRPLPDSAWVAAGGAASDPIFKLIGLGLEPETIAINGLNLQHDGFLVEQGFELRTKGLKVRDTQGTGIILNCLCNAVLDTMHFDHVGSAFKPTVRLGRSSTYGISNTSIWSNWHIERCPGVHLDLASGSNPDTDRAEWLTIVGLHIEKVIDGTDIPDYTAAPAILIGNIRGVAFLGGTILGGSGPMVRMNREVTANGVGDTYMGVTFTGVNFDGYSIPGSTPTTLIDLVNGNGVSFVNCQFMGATSEYIKVASTFGPELHLFGNTFQHDRTGTTSTADIVDARPTTYSGRAKDRFGATLCLHARGDRPGIIGGGSSPGLSLYANEISGGTGVVEIVDNPINGNALVQFDTTNKRLRYLAGNVPGANPPSNTIFQYLDPTTLKLTTRDPGGVTSEGQQTLKGAAVWDPPSIAAGGYASFVQAVTSAALGMPAVATPSVDPGDGVAVSALVSSAGNVRITIRNLTGSAVDLPSQTFTIKVFR